MQKKKKKVIQSKQYHKMKNTNKYNKRVQSIRDDEEIIQLLPGVRIKVPNRHSTYGRVKVKTIQLFLG